MAPEEPTATSGADRPPALRWAGWLAIGVSLAVLVGWLFGLPALTSVIPGQIAMKFQTAVVFLVYGVAAVLVTMPGSERRRIGFGLFGLGAALTAIICLQYVVNADFGIDHLVVREAPGAVGTVHLGRMSPQTGIALIAISITAFAARVPRFGPPVVALTAGAAFVLGAINLLDVVLGAQTPTLLRQYTQMAVPTAALITALSIGAMELLPSGGPIGRLQTASASIAPLKPVLAAAIAIPIVVGWLRLEGERRGFYDSAYGVAIMTLVTIGLFLVAIWFAAGELIRTDRIRRRAEEDRERALRETEAANRAKSEFLSRISHELRTPLNSVIGFAQLLEMDGLAPEQHDNVRYISRAGRHLLDLINEVLDISRIESGTMTISLEPVKVGEVVEEVLTLIAPLAAERQLTMRNDAAGCELHALADRQRLRQVLLNLLSNAVKYNRPGGEIRVACNEIAGDRVRIDVTDTGRGMAPDQVERLFTPFERLGAERTDVEGTGMGLALSKALVEAMRGSLTLRTQPERGTTFTVELGRATAPVMSVTEAPAIAEPVRAGPTRTVLYVEDNLANLRLVERILERIPNVRLLTAMQGSLGLELALQHRPDLVLLDLHLADMTGLDLLREIRTRPELAGCQVVMLTADATSWRVRQVLEEGALAYLTKPLDIPRFLELLDVTLGGVTEKARAS